MIDEFITNIKSSGLARDNDFNIVLSLPTLIQSSIMNSPEMLKNISMRCQEVTLPSRLFNTADRNIYGAKTSHPISEDFGTVTCSIILSSDFRERKVFDLWHKLIFDGVGFEFHDNFVTDITINKTDKNQINGENTYSVRLVDAYPTTISENALSMSSETHSILTITFAYKYWEQSDLKREFDIGDIAERVFPTKTFDAELTNLDMINDMYGLKD